MSENTKDISPLATLLYLTWCWQSLALQEHGNSAVFSAHFKPDLSAQCIFLFSLLHNSPDSRTKTNQKPHEGLGLTQWVPWWLQYPSYQEEIPPFPSPSLLVLLGQENSLTFSSTLERQMKKRRPIIYQIYFPTSRRLGRSFCSLFNPFPLAHRKWSFQRKGATPLTLWQKGIPLLLEKQ